MTLEAHRAYHRAAALKHYNKVKGDLKFRRAQSARARRYYEKHRAAILRKIKLERKRRFLTEILADQRKAHLKYTRTRTAYKLRAAAWAKKNPEARAAIRRRWWRRHPEARVVHKHKRRVRELHAVSTLTSAEWSQILRASKCCAYCGCKFTKQRKPTQDHVIPLACGGSHTKENVVAACKRCNSKKHTKLWKPKYHPSSIKK